MSESEKNKPWMDIFLHNNSKDGEEKVADGEASIQSAVTYYATSDGQIYIDINISDYEEGTMSNFAKMISNISTIKFQIETLKIIKESLVESGNGDVFDKLVEKIVLETEKDRKLLEKYAQDYEQDNKQEERPWIKPSQVITD